MNWLKPTNKFGLILVTLEGITRDVIVVNVPLSYVESTALEFE